MSMLDQRLPAPRIFADRPPSTANATPALADAARGPRRKGQPLPKPTGTNPYRLKLAQVTSNKECQKIRAAKKLVFHAIGDTGGVRHPEPQRIVAMHLAADFTGAAEADKPAFLYHLGDVIYFFGEAEEFEPQFYAPYDDYPAPIFAIPGNHDGDVSPHASSGTRSLRAFVRNFCAKEPTATSDAIEAHRSPMTQPNVYWTLDAPFARVIGLYTNVPEGGFVDAQQQAWFTQELKDAPKDVSVIVALHHPPYSVDVHHGGSAAMGQVLDDAMQESGRMIDLVLAGHVHNYQRFTRTHAASGNQTPYVVAGAGGYWHLHYLPQMIIDAALPYKAPDSDVTLVRFDTHHHGYLTLEVSAESIRGSYFTVPRPQEPWNAPATRLDTFEMNLQTRRVK